ncbi:metallophosphoesterase [Mumia sp. zg.B53]|uniref:metallophosphoesterase family protein n=1 Tax=unclassified Mumia TaxID=2621872 RepID=UPI001C6EAB2C|nr:MULTISPECIES: metallophosphoesterase [unclassified Mumia]MBW9211577.1 metallophosphoesterase [Mumia sp. zg.B21]MBW9216748.1 metallophosphoesterase [Mumia sp. zg.B53]MDD9348687.1 metallophosphoesterase [Mumia sp.]
MRFIATADWQLGMTAWFLGDEARARFQQARLDAVRRIGDLAAERDAAFAVVCGDVFESNQLDRAIVARTFEVLRGFSVPVVLLPGNHDPLDAASIYDSRVFAERKPDHVHVLRDSAPFTVVEGAEVVGAPWFGKHPTRDLVADACAGLRPTSGDLVRVVAGHGVASTFNPDRDALAAIDVPTLTKALDSGRAHVAVLGDRHSTTEIESRIWYAGAPEVTSRREDDPGNVLVVDVDPESRAVTVDPVRVGRWRFEVVEQELASSEDVDRLADRLEQMPDKDRTAVWLALSGTLSTAEMARLDGVLEHGSDLFARLDAWERHTDLVVLPDGHDFADLGLSGFAQAALDELAELARSDAPDATVAQDALGLLYRLAGAGR